MAIRRDITVICDRCGETATYTNCVVSEGKYKAEGDGWNFRGHDYCPECSKVWDITNWRDVKKD